MSPFPEAAVELLPAKDLPVALFFALGVESALLGRFAVGCAAVVAEDGAAAVPRAEACILSTNIFFFFFFTS